MMNTARNSFPAYGQWHDALLAQRSLAASAEDIQQVNRALLAGERLRAAFYELSQLQQVQQRKSQRWQSHKAEKEIAHFLEQLAAITPKTVSDAAQFSALQRQVAAIGAEFHWHHASLLQVQNSLFNHTCDQWHKVLKALFRAGHYAAALHHLQRLLNDALRNLPVLGDQVGLYPVLAELRSRSDELAAAGTEDPPPLARYTAAADVATRGLLLLGLTAEAVLRGRPLPTPQEREARIRQHDDQVIERTHPWFTAE